jgi:hypothetical protein
LCDLGMKRMHELTLKAQAESDVTPREWGLQTPLVEKVLRTLRTTLKVLRSRLFTAVSAVLFYGWVLQSVPEKAPHLQENVAFS